MLFLKKQTRFSRFWRGFYKGCFLFGGFVVVAVVDLRFSKVFIKDPWKRRCTSRVRALEAFFLQSS